MFEKQKEYRFSKLVENSEINPWSLESFGVFLRQADFLDQKIFPLSVSFPKDHEFRLKLDKLLGAKFPDNFIEHIAVVATNDVGELKLSNISDRGSFYSVRLKEGSEAYHAHQQTIPLPPAWRKLGVAHNHPRFPYGKIGYLITERMIPMRFSGQDVTSFISQIASNSNTEVVVTPGGYGLLIASKKTRNFLDKNPKYEVSKVDSLKIELNPRPFLEKLGIIYYGCSIKEQAFRRLI